MTKSNRKVSFHGAAKHKSIYSKLSPSTDGNKARLPGGGVISIYSKLSPSKNKP